MKIDEKLPKGQPKQQWLDTLDSDLKAVRPHPDQVYDWATEQDEPTRFLNETKAEEEEEES